MPGSNTSKLPAPSVFAAYMAASALLTSSSASTWPSGVASATAMPTLNRVRTWRPATSTSSAPAAMIRLATSTASSSEASSRSTANSSPPRRATVSWGRTHACSRRATSFRSRSPAAWPERVVDPLEAVEVEVDDRVRARAGAWPG